MTNTAQQTPGRLKAHVDFTALARKVMFSSALDPVQEGLVFRKGKSSADVEAARKKAIKVDNGRAKLENELSMLEVYLQQVFLLHRSSRLDPAPAAKA
jgi:hypothetical protein